MLILSFDTETTGIPDYKVPSESEHQPHLVQLGAELFDLQGVVHETLDVIIKPDSWIIPQDTVDVHGITQERAMAEGIRECDALAQLMGMARRAVLRTAYNTTFDNRIVRIAQARYFPQDAIHDEIMRSWKEDKWLYLCTMIEAQRVIGRRVKLEEAYLYFTGSVLQNQHNALADAQASKVIYLKLLEQGHIQPPTPKKEGELLC